MFPVQLTEMPPTCKKTPVVKHALVTWMVKCLPAVRENWVLSLCWEDPLEKEMATHSSILAWRIPWMRSLEGYIPWGHKESDTTEWLTLSLSTVTERLNRSCWQSWSVCNRLFQDVIGRETVTKESQTEHCLLTVCKILD